LQSGDEISVPIETYKEVQFELAARYLFDVVSKKNNCVIVKIKDRLMKNGTEFHNWFERLIFS
jgi:hypothetical protein